MENFPTNASYMTAVNTKLFVPMRDTKQTLFNKSQIPANKGSTLQAKNKFGTIIYIHFLVHINAASMFQQVK